MKHFVALVCILAAGSLSGCVTHIKYQPKNPGDPKGHLVLLLGIPVYLSAIPAKPEEECRDHGPRPHSPRDGRPPMDHPRPMGERGQEQPESREQIEHLSRELRQAHEELEKRERVIHELKGQIEKKK